MSLISRVRVRVPASTSNLGPGFDCLGLALGLYNELILEMHSETGDPVIEIRGEGAQSLPRGPQNLIVRAALGLIRTRLKNRLVFRAVNRIPLARGLGSSAAAVVAGLWAANHLFDEPLEPPEELLRRACELEGHPDNVAACVLGGLIVSVPSTRDWTHHALKPHRDLCAVICVPEFELATSKARAALPARYDRTTAVGNVARALLLGSALERGLWERLATAMEDGLHQPFRSHLIRGFSTVLRAGRGPASGTALSGAGPSMLALRRRGPRAPLTGRAMQKAFLRHGVESRVLVLPVDRQGVQVMTP